MARAKKAKKKPAKRTSKRAPAAAPADVEQQIIAAVRRIPRGRVSTYGDIARVAGLPRRARLVGTLLRQTSAKLPWYRVINASGRSSLPDGSDAQRRQCSLLEREGVEVRRGRVDLSLYGWPARDQPLDELLWKLED